MSHASVAKITRQRLQAHDEHPIKAQDDPAGNCIFCGEAGRCPGWHALSEVRKIIKGTVPDEWDIPF